MTTALHRGGRLPHGSLLLIMLLLLQPGEDMSENDDEEELGPGSARLG